ncbi:hypothetical protein HD806DRAFT_248942 [Xylariaceae sp. AK1471]|nr:hypothetical protein HD806DRAFT_248942 [Xylariaceae sp. AK1471]
MERASLEQGTKRRYSRDRTKRALSNSDDRQFGDHNTTAGTLSAGPEPTPSRLGGNEDAVLGQSTPDQTALSTEAGDPNEHYFKNLYSTEPDFYRLGLKYPEFGAMLKDGVYLDFTDPAAVMQLTRTLLKEDFGLQINLPPDRLCPPVPNRHNYILWLKDLVDSTSSSYSEQYEPKRRVTGLDIGTGASLIYPLLGCAQRPWHFTATDIDIESLASARTNARTNHLQSRIRIVGRAALDPLIPLKELDINNLDFVMVNPPFYTSNTELLDLAAQKSRPPSSACTGAPVEMVCEGGEVGFVQRMINESLVLRERVQWYTAMLGKQSSLEVLIDILKKHKINNYAVTAFIQGSKTRRWALGWSFLTRRPSLGASRGCIPLATKGMLPPVTAITIHRPSFSIQTDAILLLKNSLRGTMETLDLRSWVWDEQRLRGVGFADGNVWSRAYRRRKAGENVLMKQETVVPPLDLTTCGFGFSISIQVENRDKSCGRPAVIVRWLQGDDYSLFESFAGVVQRCLRTEPARSA